MKVLLLLISLLFTSTVFARGEGTSGGGAGITNRNILPSMSWKVINSVKDIKISFPYIHLKNRKKISFVPYNSFCADGENLKVIKPQSKCVDWKKASRYLPARCRKFEKEWISTPREYRSTSCVEWIDVGDRTDCIKFETNIETHPLNKEITVYSLKKRSNNEVVQKELFIKEFELPDCYDAIKAR